jgi:predicted nucleotidyltransferase
MTDSSNPRSVQPVKPVDPSACRMLRLVDRAATAVGSRYFVAGAMARDLVLVNTFGLPPGRATRDIDFGVAVENWEQFQSLKGALMESGQFVVAPEQAQRLIWTDPDRSASIVIDLIPFGGFTSESKKLAWPPDKDVVMNVAGFEEALESSLQLRVEEDLVVRVASIPGLAVLKLIAWQDRRYENDKDAADLVLLLTNYADAGNLDRIYSEELPLLEAAQFDLELAGAELLGRDAARICQEKTLRELQALLGSEQLIDQLVRQMSQTSFIDEAQMERSANILRGFCRGFLGR